MLVQDFVTHRKTLVQFARHISKPGVVTLLCGAPGSGKFVEVHMHVRIARALLKELEHAVVYGESQITKLREQLDAS